jgi:hypothetical protein
MTRVSPGRTAPPSQRRARGRSMRRAGLCTKKRTMPSSDTTSACSAGASRLSCSCSPRRPQPTTASSQTQHGRNSLDRSARRPLTRRCRGLSCPRGVPSAPHGHRGEAAAALGACLPDLTDVTRLSIQDLDNTTFDRIVGQGLPVLVRVDKEYPYGDSDDAWKEVGAVRPMPQPPRFPGSYRLGRPAGPPRLTTRACTGWPTTLQPAHSVATPWSAGGGRL